MRSATGPASSSGSTSAIQTKRLRPASSFRTCAEALWSVRPSGFSTAE